jgi:hypothetical protein
MPQAPALIAWQQAFLVLLALEALPESLVFPGSIGSEQPVQGLMA